VNAIQPFTFLNRIWGIVTPFVYGFVLAYIISIPYDAIQRLLAKCRLKFIRKRRKLFSFIIILIFLALIIFLISFFLLPAINKSINQFVDELPIYIGRTLELVDDINEIEMVKNFGIDLSLDGLFVMLQNVSQGFSFDSVLEYVTSSFNVILGISNAIFGGLSALFTGFLAFISSIYFLVEKDRVKLFLLKLLKSVASAKIYRLIIRYGSKLDKNFKQYIKTQTIDGLILGTIVTIELLIMRSPFALILGIMLGIINYIPYFGSIVGSLIAVVIVAFTQGITMAAIAAVVLLITQQIDGNVIQPKLMGGSFALSPLLVIVSITVGGAFAGIFGMIAAIPIVAVLKDMLTDIIEFNERKRLEKSQQTEETENENNEF
jgi:predicted PurR-regulated permease PerM